MRQDPVEYEREARHSLADASRELRAELGTVVTDVSILRTNIIQIVEEGVSEIFSHVDGINKATKQNISAMEALFHKIENIDVSPNLISEKFTPILNEFREVAKEAAERIRSQSSDVNRLRTLVETAEKAMNTLERNFSTFESATEEKTSKLNEAYESNLELISSQSEKVRELYKTLGNTVESVAMISEKINGSLEGARTLSQNAASDIKENLETVRQYRKTLSASADEAQEAVRLVQQNLVSLTQTIVQELGVKDRA